VRARYGMVRVEKCIATCKFRELGMVLRMRGDRTYAMFSRDGIEVWNKLDIRLVVK